ncbi:MAG: hypothetical protein M1820_002776 [Bogoriella megaspora]|nr:MAG: hypothetical protein M1820_002776 [Bogoriella megaspora]
MATKSILKKSTGSDATVEAQAARDQRNREIAIHHATLIQQQKDVEAQILAAIEELLDFPSSPDADPAQPSPADVSRFKALVVPFQPGDYDSLLEERHCADTCGYVLCPRKPTKQKTNAKMRILGRGVDSGDMRVVPTKQLEMWCSKDCAKRALYIKTQLNEEPGWLRRASSSVTLYLLGERTQSTFAATLAERPKVDSAESAEASVQKTMSNLALERGENESSVRSKGLLNDDVLENTITRPAKAPSSSADHADHKLVEGYDPQIDFEQYRKASRSQDEEEEDNDWIL